MRGEIVGGEDGREYIYIFEFVGRGELEVFSLAKDLPSYHHLVSSLRKIQSDLDKTLPVAIRLT